MRAYVLSLLMMTVNLAGCISEGGLSIIRHWEHDRR